MANKYPDYIMEKCRQRLGLKPEDTSEDCYINSYTPSEAFDECCKWHGFIGYGNTLLGWVEDCFNIDLKREVAEQLKKRTAMTNAEKIQKMTTWELAEFIYDVSNHATPITTCNNECEKCECTDAYCINGIGEWLNSTTN